jgi:hypothetical protein
MILEIPNGPHYRQSWQWQLLWTTYTIRIKEYGAKGQHKLNHIIEAWWHTTSAHRIEHAHFPRTQQNLRVEIERIDLSLWPLKTASPPVSDMQNTCNITWCRLSTLPCSWPCAGPLAAGRLGPGKEKWTGVSNTRHGDQDLPVISHHL